MLNNILKILILFVILLIIEYLWLNYYKKNYKHIWLGKDAEKRFESNINNEEKIIQVFKDTLEKRLQLLKTMNYDDWLEYNKNNKIVEFNGQKYFIFIYESSNFDSMYIVRSTLNDDMYNRNHKLERQMIINEYSLLEQFPPYENLPAEMQMMTTDNNGFNNLSYNWLHGYLKIPVKYNTIFTKYNQDNFKGIIGMSYAKEDLYVKYLNIYYNFIDKFNLFVLNFFIVFVSIVLYLIDSNDKNFIQSIIILFISWLFLLYQLSQTATTTTIQIETEKGKELSQNFLGASFLIGINVFIINLLDNKNKLISKIDTANIKKSIVFLFFMVVLFLLVSLVKTDNFKSADDLRRLRINKQFYYNFSIFYNLIICVIFIGLIFKTIFKLDNFKF